MDKKVTYDDVHDFGWNSAEPGNLNVTLASICAQLNLIGQLLVDIRDQIEKGGDDGE